MSIRGPSIKTVTLYVIPAVFLVVFVDVLPAVVAFVLSLFKISFFSGGVFVGLQNYVTAFRNLEFYHSLFVSVAFCLCSVMVTVVLSMVLALILDRLGRYGVFLLSIILIPWIISRIAAALLWKWILDSSTAGLMNSFLALLGLGTVPFLSNDLAALISLIFVAVWRTLGYGLILLFAGLKNIPNQLIKAARVDGASGWYRFVHVILPLIRHPLLVVLSVLTLSYFNEIALVIGLTNGGPINATTTLSYLVFKEAMINYNTGYANTLALVLFFVSISLVLLYYRLLTARRIY
jgi:ABC-type sugar transport system permease subunit